MLHSGCSADTVDERLARRAAEQYLAALVAHDQSALRERATCFVPAGSIRGATLLRAGRVERHSRGSLDSLTAAALEDERRAAADWSRASEWDADSLWLRHEALARRAALYRSATLAAERSARPTGAGADTDTIHPHAAAATLRTCAIPVRIRWGGPLVGPESVDREHVLRALATPGGPWIVFSLEQREDDLAAGLGSMPLSPTSALARN